MKEANQGFYTPIKRRGQRTNFRRFSVLSIGISRFKNAFFFIDESCDKLINMCCPKIFCFADRFQEKPIAYGGPVGFTRITIAYGEFRENAVSYRGR